MSLSALDDDIRLKHGSANVPHERDKLIEWVKNPVNLDMVTEAFRRVCSGYVSTGRLFAVSSGPFYLDWPAVISQLATGYSSIYSASVFMDISGKGRVLTEEVEKLNRALDLIKEVQDSVSLADMVASLPSPAERMGEVSE